MKRESFEKIDRIALAMVRQNKEKSRALPTQAYGDPCRYLMREEEEEQRRKEQMQRRAKGRR